MILRNIHVSKKCKATSSKQLRRVTQLLFRLKKHSLIKKELLYIIIKK